MERELNQIIRQKITMPSPCPCRRMPGGMSICPKGVMMLPHIARAQLFPEKDFETWQRPKVTENDRWLQLVEACRGTGQTAANFDYAGPLTEAILLGSVATRFPNATMQWNAPGLKFTNLPDANQYIRRHYREGWEVKGL